VTGKLWLIDLNTIMECKINHQVLWEKAIATDFAMDMNKEA
jgi:hypothetical protein